MENICTYYNNENEEINIYFDENHECVTIINYNSENIHMIKELKNANLDILEFISNDFNCFDSINEEHFIIYKDDINYIKNHTKYGKKVVKEVIEDYEIEIRE